MRYFFLLLFPLAVQGQKLNTKVDRISGDTLVYTSPEVLYRKVSFSGTVGERVDVIASRNGAATLLTLQIRTGSSDFNILKEGDALELKLTNGKVVKLLNQKVDVTKYTWSSIGGYVTGNYLLTDEAIAVLQESPVQYVRVSHSDGYLDYDIKGKFADVIQKAVSAL